MHADQYVDMGSRGQGEQHVSEQEGRAGDEQTHRQGEDALTERIWEKHVFVCTSGKYCPQVDGDGLGVHARLKALVRAEGLTDHVRVNHAGCFDQCGYGPMVVVYPEGVWYAHVQPDDVDEIVRAHLIGARPVE